MEGIHVYVWRGLANRSLNLGTKAVCGIKYVELCGFFLEFGLYELL